MPLLACMIGPAFGCDSTPTSDGGLDAGTLDVPSSELDVPSSEIDAGESDGGSVMDTPSPGSDAPSSCTDGGVTDAVAACEAAALDMSTRCGGGSDRECEWLAIRDLCATERAAVLLAEMDCTRAFSSEPGGTGCRTFGDPSGARDCIVAAHRCFDVTRATSVADQVSAAFTSLCGGAPSASPLDQGYVPFAALSDGTLDAMAACSAAVSCDALVACLQGPFPDLLACYP